MRELRSIAATRAFQRHFSMGHLAASLLLAPPVVERYT
jgi:hypothetical protein